MELPGYKNISQFAEKHKLPRATVYEHMDAGKCEWPRERKMDSKHDLYTMYRRIMRKCYDETNPVFPLYGAQGIKMCGRWYTSFPAFVKDVGPRPSASSQLVLVDKSGHFSPDNCRWEEQKEMGLTTQELGRWRDYSKLWEEPGRNKRKILRSLPDLVSA